LRSRLEFSRDNPARAKELAEQAALVAEDPDTQAVALLNLARLRSLWGFDDLSLQFATDARRSTTDPTHASIAEAFLLVGGLCKLGDLDAGSDQLRALAARQEREGLHWYRAITLLNQALALEWAGSLTEALSVATTAESEMARLGSRGVERAAALVGRANILAKLGRRTESGRLVDQALAMSSSVARGEAAIEACRLHTAFGTLSEAEAALQIAEAASFHDNPGLVQLVRGEIALRRYELVVAREAATSLDAEPCADISGLLRSRLFKTRVALALDHPDAGTFAGEALEIAALQHSRPGQLMAALLRAIVDGAGLSELLVGLDPASTYVVSMLAESLAAASSRMTLEAWQLVAQEAYQRPERWHDTLLAETTRTSSERCAELLATIGDGVDAAQLRTLAADSKLLRAPALRITQRLAQQVQIVDLGHIEVFLGSERLRVARRKVTGLLCFLGSRPTMAATRDEVLEALWPDLSPETATNSLHQTIYFLRRAFEPDYREGLSAGYVTYDGEIVALSDDLCDSLSRRCWRSIRRVPKDPEALTELLDQYRGKFALDFAYDDWASDYRDNLHAAVLAAAESGMTRLLMADDSDRAIQIGHRMLGVAPDADAIELLLLRAYKHSGRHAAAAEQYAHYAAVQRHELGVVPPPLDEI
jgi:DNA-binding SARP family transcriptional activator